MKTFTIIMALVVLVCVAFAKDSYTILTCVDYSLLSQKVMLLLP